VSLKRRGPASPPAAERIDFTDERERHLRFVGRDDVLARLDEWLLGPDETRWVVVTGGPGMGKSAILSKWLDRREAAGAAVPHHFVRRQVIDWDQPERVDRRRVRAGCAAIHLQGLADRDRPKLAVRDGIDAGNIVLATDPAEAPSISKAVTGGGIGTDPR
jgi:hypothetical protein